MKSFIDRFSGLVKGTLSGFDRIVFKGLILPLMFATEVMNFTGHRPQMIIRLKRNHDFKSYRREKLQKKNYLISIITSLLVNPYFLVKRDTVSCMSPSRRLPWRDGDMYGSSVISFQKG